MINTAAVVIHLPSNTASYVLEAINSQKTKMFLYFSRSHIYSTPEFISIPLQDSFTYSVIIKLIDVFAGVMIGL